jgi:hypothetical protein
MDPDNPVVELCVEGMQAEFQGRDSDALQLFTRAWETSRDDYEACIAAHYLARHQTTPQDMLFWNQTALDRAAALGGSVAGFYPSLYLNLGYSYELLGDKTQAAHFYDLAAAHLDLLPTGPYADLVRQGVANAHLRLHPPDE